MINTFDTDVNYLVSGVAKVDPMKGQRYFVAAYGTDMDSTFSTIFYDQAFHFPSMERANEAIKEFVKAGVFAKLALDDIRIVEVTANFKLL